MARFRLSKPAELDIATILRTSEQRWGIPASARYAALLAKAMHAIAADPVGPLTRPLPKLRGGIRRFHTRHARGAKARVNAPVHVILYRIADPELIEIVRVVHERMEPSAHLPTKPPRRQ